MKFFSKFVLTFLVLTVSLSVSYGQFDAMVSCAKERGVTDEQLQALKNGDFSSVTNLFGCFADYVCKKLGVITDDTFNPEAFETHVNNLLSPDLAKEALGKCTPLAGTGECAKECAISGNVMKCGLGYVVARFMGSA